MELFPPLKPQTVSLVNNIPALIDKTFPIPERFLRAVPQNVAELSRFLTSERSERSLSYLNRPGLLSAYLRYYLPWNIYRLCRLLPSLELNLAPGDSILDLGCGPLTFAAALWISRPELRDTQLEIYCVDQSGPALEAGKKFFTALAGGYGSGSSWRIVTVKNRVSSYAHKKQAALVCAINLFNEINDEPGNTDSEYRRKRALNAGRLLNGCCQSAGGSILVVEPGDPNSGQFISLLRGALLELGRPPAAPCTHCGPCPMPGGFSDREGKRNKNRWCHFAFDTEDAGESLHRLSGAAGIPKERAALSFLLCLPAHAGAADRQASGSKRNSRKENAQNPAGLRVISDSFPLPDNNSGRYGCSHSGLVLLTGSRSKIEKTSSGSLINAKYKNGRRDSKSGALLAEF
jgi:SAM-dependent methyltransferase